MLKLDAFQLWEVTFLDTSATNGISLPSASNSLPPLK